MRNCKRCRGGGSPASPPDTLFRSKLSIDDSLSSVEVLFSHYRILQSQITKEKFKTMPGEFVKVYTDDLATWIGNGIKGVRFKDLSDEVNFIEKYGIVPAQYV